MNRFRTLVEKVLHSPTHWVMGITAAGMGFGLIFHVLLIPTRFGGSEAADAMIAALKVVLLVDTVVREGAKFSLVPLFVTEAQLRSSAEYQRFTNGILNFSLGVGLVIFLLIEAFAPLIANGLPMEMRAEMVTLLRICAPLVIFGCGSTILGAFLNSQKRFKTVALRNALPPGMATAVFLLLWETENLAHWIAITYAGDFFVYFGWLCIGTHRTGHQYQLTWLSMDTLRSLKNTITLPTLGFAIRQGSARLLVEVYLVGQLGRGAITLYNSAFRIFSAVQTLIGISIATTGLPDMATPGVVDNMPKLKRTLHRNVCVVLLIALPVTLLLLLSHTKILSLLYRGSKFDEGSIQQIARVLFWLSTGMVFSCLIPVLNAGLYAQKAYPLVFRNMVTMAVLNVSVAYGFVGAWGLPGIALAVSGTAVLAVLNLAYLLRKTGISFFAHALRRI